LLSEDTGFFAPEIVVGNKVEGFNGFLEIFMERLEDVDHFQLIRSELLGSQPVKSFPLLDVSLGIDSGRFPELRPKLSG